MPRRPAASARPERGQLGTVRRLPSGRFQAFYVSAGQRFTAPATFPTEREGWDWLEAERVDRRRGAWLNPTVGAATLADYAEGWLSDRADLAPRSWDYYRRTLDRWILPAIDSDRGPGVALGGFSLHAITPAIVRTWHAQVLAAARTAALRRLAPTGRPIHPARAWAAASGHPVASSGRLSPSLLAAWHAAGSPEPAAAPSSGVADAHRDAGRTSAAQAYRVLRAILTTAHDDGLIPSNPCRIKGAGTVHHRERTIASPAEVDAIAAAFPERMRAAVILAAWSGLRYGEQFALTRRDLDLTAGTVRVSRALEHVPGQPVRFGAVKTASSRRTIHLPGFVIDELRGHLRRHVGAYPDALLFTQGDGSPVTGATLSRLMRRARATIDRDELSWHDLRHTSATLAYRAGASTREVMDRLGHSTTRAAQIYAHAADDSDRLLADRLAAMRDPAPIADLRRDSTATG